jgi:hypothetical protein
LNGIPLSSVHHQFDGPEHIRAVFALGCWHNMIDLEKRIVARGVWLYDGKIPKEIEVVSRPAKLAGSRFKEAEAEDNPPPQDTPDGYFLDQNAPIPETPDGFVYYLSSGSGEFRTLDAAKRWADAQPWGPVTWE